MQPEPVFEWPNWAKAYVYIVAAPFAVLSFGLLVWSLMDQLTVFSSGLAGAILLMISFMMSFILSGILFVTAVERVWHQKSEALSFAASGHLMLMMPGMFLLLTGFFRENAAFLNGFERFLDEGQLTIDVVFMIWVITNTYLALILAMADNSARFVVEAQLHDAS